MCFLHECTDIICVALLPAVSCHDLVEEIRLFCTVMLPVGLFLCFFRIHCDSVLMTVCFFSTTLHISANGFDFRRTHRPLLLHLHMPMVVAVSSASLAARSRLNPQQVLPQKKKEPQHQEHVLLALFIIWRMIDAP